MNTATPPGPGDASGIVQFKRFLSARPRIKSVAFSFAYKIGGTDDLYTTLFYHAAWDGDQFFLREIQTPDAHLVKTKRPVTDDWEFCGRHGKKFVYVENGMIVDEEEMPPGSSCDFRHMHPKDRALAQLEILDQCLNLGLPGASVDSFAWDQNRFSYQITPDPGSASAPETDAAGSACSHEAHLTGPAQEDQVGPPKINEEEAAKPSGRSARLRHGSFQFVDGRLRGLSFDDHGKHRFSFKIDVVPELVTVVEKDAAGPDVTHYLSFSGPAKDERIGLPQNNRAVPGDPTGVSTRRRHGSIQVVDGRVQSISFDDCSQTIEYGYSAGSALGIPLPDKIIVKLHRKMGGAIRIFHLETSEGPLVEAHFAADTWLEPAGHYRAELTERGLASLNPPEGLAWREAGLLQDQDEDFFSNTMKYKNVTCWPEDMR